MLAAASLTDVLPALDATPRYGFGGSSELATQVREGSAADVYVTADPRLARELQASGDLTGVRRFGGNRLVVALAPGNPAEIGSPADLARSDVRLVLAQEGVPVGDYARRALRGLDLDAALDNVVSDERDTRGALAKVALGEADAAVVYATDVASLRSVATVPIPERAQPDVRYAVGLVRDTPGARRFVARLTGPEGTRALADAGFASP